MAYVQFMFLLSLLLLPFLVLNQRRRRGLPPGPPGLPIIGNILQFGKNPHKSLADLAKIYGPLMHLKLGLVDMIVVSSPEIAKQVLQKYDHLLSDRPHLAFTRAYDHNKTSMVWVKEITQRTAMRKLCKDHLFSQKKLDQSEILRSKKIDDLRHYLQNCCKTGSVVNIADAAFTTSLNMTSSSLFSIDFATFDSQKSQEIKEIVNGTMEAVGASNLADYFPFLKPCDPQGIQRKCRIYFGKLFEIFDGIIDERVKPKNDLLQALLDINSRDASEFTRHHMLHLLLVSPIHSQIKLWAKVELTVRISGFICGGNGHNSSHN